MPTCLGTKTLLESVVNTSYKHKGLGSWWRMTILLRMESFVKPNTLYICVDHMLLVVWPDLLIQKKMEECSHNAPPHLEWSHCSNQTLYIHVCNIYILLIIWPGLVISKNSQNIQPIMMQTRTRYQHKEIIMTWWTMSMHHTCMLLVWPNFLTPKKLRKWVEYDYI